MGIQSYRSWYYITGNISSDAEILLDDSLVTGDIMVESDVCILKYYSIKNKIHFVFCGYFFKSGKCLILQCAYLNSE